VVVEPLSSNPTQSPAHSFVPLTVPTSLHPIGPFGFTCTSGLLPTFGGALCANAEAEKQTVARTSNMRMVHFPLAFSPQLHKSPYKRTGEGAILLRLDAGEAISTSLRAPK
jgi:hypothetical protein